MQWPRLKIVRHKTEDKLAIDHEGYWWDPEYHEAETYVPLALLEQKERLYGQAVIDCNEQVERANRAEALLEQVEEELRERAEGYAPETGIGSAYNDAADLLRSMRQEAGK